jgi:hypothetical protein
VSERLPEKGIDVLAVVCDGYDKWVDNDFLMSNGEWAFENGDRHITHWMPLPEPPKEGQMMKKQIACTECKGSGYITMTRMYDDLCGIGCKPCPSCNGTGFHEVDMTNADRIRAWNDHELAETIANFVSEIDNGDVRYSDDPNDWLKWLQQPVEDEL